MEWRNGKVGNLLNITSPVTACNFDTSLSVLVSGRGEVTSRMSTIQRLDKAYKLEPMQSKLWWCKKLQFMHSWNEKQTDTWNFFADIAKNQTSTTKWQLLNFWSPKRFLSIKESKQLSFELQLINSCPIFKRGECENGRKPGPM